MHGLVTLGETMGLFRARGIGSLAHESEFILGIGGAESNVAIGVVRLGGAATWIGRVGADSMGERIVRELRGEGLTLRAVIDTDAATGLMIKERRTAAHTRVRYYRHESAGSRLTVSDLDESLIRTAGVLHVTGITPALSPSAAAAVDAAIDMAVDAGVAVSFDVNHRESLWSGLDARAVYRRLAARSTVVFAGEDEAALLVGEGTPSEVAARLSDLGPRTVIIKRGADGCLAHVDGREHEVPAIPIDPVDTVGAGDAFVAGYLVEALAGEPLERRLGTAVRAGAFACLGPGDWESLARRDELSILDGGDPVSR